ncbi:hypothetical protein EON67_00025 [archaeon]|nr:MAG: hypothetical protein EON67_00025 [archaeon]
MARPAFVYPRLACTRTRTRHPCRRTRAPSSPCHVTNLCALLPTALRPACGMMQGGTSARAPYFTRLVTSAAKAVENFLKWQAVQAEKQSTSRALTAVHLSLVAVQQISFAARPGVATWMGMPVINAVGTLLTYTTMLQTVPGVSDWIFFIVALCIVNTALVLVAVSSATLGSSAQHNTTLAVTRFLVRALSGGLYAPLMTSLLSVLDCASGDAVPIVSPSLGHLWRDSNWVCGGGVHTALLFFGCASATALTLLALTCAAVCVDHRMPAFSGASIAPTLLAQMQSAAFSVSPASPSVVGGVLSNVQMLGNDMGLGQFPRAPAAAVRFDGVGATALGMGGTSLMDGEGEADPMLARALAPVGGASMPNMRATASRALMQASVATGKAPGRMNKASLSASAHGRSEVLSLLVRCALCLLLTFQHYVSTWLVVIACAAGSTLLLVEYLLYMPYYFLDVNAWQAGAYGFMLWTTVAMGTGEVVSNPEYAGVMWLFTAPIAAYCAYGLHLAMRASYASNLVRRALHDGTLGTTSAFVADAQIRCMMYVGAHVGILIPNLAPHSSVAAMAGMESAGRQAMTSDTLEPIQFAHDAYLRMVSTLSAQPWTHYFFASFIRSCKHNRLLEMVRPAHCRHAITCARGRRVAPLIAL